MVIRVERAYRTGLSLDWEKVKPLELDPRNTPTMADLAVTVEGKTDEADVRIDLEKFWGERRLQELAFGSAAEIFDQMAPDWPGARATLCARLVALTLKFLESDRIVINGLWNQNPLRRRILIGMNMTRIVQHFWEAIESSNTESLTPVFDPEKPIRSTGDMRVWYTGKAVGPARRSHINFCVYDGTFEPVVPPELDGNPAVEAWVKNDHLGFEVSYAHRGVVRRYLPDFLIRLTNGTTLVLEVKGEPKELDDSKWAYMRDWIEAVNAHGGFGRWAFEVMTPDDSLPPSDRRPRLTSVAGDDVPAVGYGAVPGDGGPGPHVDGLAGVVGDDGNQIPHPQAVGPGAGEDAVFLVGPFEDDIPAGQSPESASGMGRVGTHRFPTGVDDGRTRAGTGNDAGDHRKGAVLPVGAPVKHLVGVVENVGSGPGFGHPVGERGRRGGGSGTHRHDVGFYSGGPQVVRRFGQGPPRPQARFFQGGAVGARGRTHGLRGSSPPPVPTRAGRPDGGPRRALPPAAPPPAPGRCPLPAEKGRIGRRRRPLG